MQKIVPVKCPKCNNEHSFYRYGKDKDGFQKYLCHKCKHQFAPYFNNIVLELMTMLNFDSDEWHADETTVKISGKKYYIWFIMDSETRFVLGFHLSPHRDSEQVFSLLNSVKSLGQPVAIVSDRYSAYKVPVKTVLGNNIKHIRVESFKDDISNNLIESFHHQFKAWYKTKQGFNSFESANNLISMFLFFYNFVRPHSSLNGLTPAQVAGLTLTAKQKKKYLLVA
ncbi:MAG: IS1/IS6 family transposase [Clostridiaceae bacterium]|nr:IS1/IS6 family transposase [Clostridiaceae bacterium]